MLRRNHLCFYSARALLLGAFFSGGGCQFNVAVPVVVESEVHFTVDDAVRELASGNNTDFPDPYPNDDFFPPQRRTLELVTARQVDLRGKQQIADNKDKIRDVHLEAVDFQVTDNSLTHDLALVEVFIGPAGLETLTGFEEDVARLVVLPRLPAGETVAARLDFLDAQRPLIKRYFMQFNFSILLRVLVDVDTEKNLRRPTGGAAINMQARLTFVGDVLGATGGEDAQ
ncbi:MAG: hypothetical protein ABIH03_10325 [Pseudomonadota bacterium]